MKIQIVLLENWALALIENAHVKKDWETLHIAEK